MTYYLDLDSFGSYYSGWFIDVYRCLWFDVLQHPENLLHGHSYSTDLQRCSFRPDHQLSEGSSLQAPHFSLLI